LQIDTIDDAVDAMVGVLDGEPGPRRDICLLNAAAALVISGQSENLGAGLGRAADAVDSRRAKTALQTLVRLSNTN
jgi:anthranilate phosphoribosyltransferase